MFTLNSCWCVGYFTPEAQKSFLLPPKDAPTVNSCFHICLLKARSSTVKVSNSASSTTLVRFHISTLQPQFSALNYLHSLRINVITLDDLSSFL